MFPSPYRWISSFSLQGCCPGFFYTFGDQIRRYTIFNNIIYEASEKNLKDRNLEADPKTRINKACCTLKHKKQQQIHGRTCSPTKTPKTKKPLDLQRNEQGNRASVTEIITSRVFWSNKKVTKIFHYQKLHPKKPSPSNFCPSRHPAVSKNSLRVRCRRSCADGIGVYRDDFCRFLMVPTARRGETVGSLTLYLRVRVEVIVTIR